MSRYIPLLPAYVVLFSAPGWAAEPQNLPENVVTATRSSMAKNRLDTATTVFTRQDMERLQVNTLPDLLKTATGLQVIENGGYGKNTSVMMRGTNADHVLVLVDGVKVGSATLGTASFQFLPIDQIERVEIIRGPQSSKYGSEAIGGVIQIFTRQGKRGEQTRLNLDAGAGAYDTYRVGGMVSGNWRDAWYTLSASRLDTEGFNARLPIPGPFGFSQPDRDGHDNTAINSRAGYRFSERAEVEAFYTRAMGKSEFDGTFQNRLDFVQQVVGVAGNFKPTDIWQSRLQLGQSRDDSNNFAPSGRYTGKFDTTRWNASWVNEVALHEKHQLVLGTDYRIDEIDSETRYAETERYDVGVFGELNNELFDRHFVNASIRWDENQAFGNAVTGGIGWRHPWAYGVSSVANFGTAFKAPTFNDLYFPLYGNPNLDPEQSQNVEVGLIGEHGWGGWEIRAYHNQIDNLISPVMNPVTFQFSAQNIGKAHIEGIETELNTNLFGWKAKWTGSLLDPRNTQTHARLPRRSERTLNFDLSRSFGALDIGGSVLAQSNRFDDVGNTRLVGGFVTLDLRSAYHFDKHWEIRAKLANLLDKEYQTAATFPSAGRNFFLSIHYAM